MLRIDGGIPYETMQELGEDELLHAWDNFVRYCEQRERAMREALSQKGK